MNSNRSYWLFGILLIGIVGVGIYFYQRDTSALKDVKNENVRMSQKIDEAESKQKDAIIQKRISEQLEEIAQQQKLITESQKTIALEQRVIAEQKQNEAVIQKQVADRAKTRAVSALEDAEKQKKIAVEQKNAAEAAEKNTNRLRMLALGQSLSARSINQNNAGNDTLASMLALAAWQFTEENQGDLYQSELFQALKIASKEENVLRAHKGFIRDLALMPSSSENDLKLSSVSESGEIILWTGNSSSLQPKILFKNDSYDLRKVCFNKEASMLAASDLTGNVILLKEPFNSSQAQSFKLSDYKIDALAFINTNTLVFNEETNIIGTNVTTGGSSVQQIYGHTDMVTNIWFDAPSNLLYFSDDKGQFCSVKPNSGDEAKVILNLKDHSISCFVVDENGKIAVGTNSGKIYVKNSEDNNLTELIGHISEVNDLAFEGEELISIGYDKTVRLWNLASSSTESVIIEQHKDWGYCINNIAGSGKIVSAGADKFLRITTIDPQRLAKLVQKNVNRDFTQDEWNTYVDPTVKFKSFNQK